MTDTNEQARVHLQIASAQLQGGRMRQEDVFLTRCTDRGWIVLVADGLGGHAHGDEASRTAAGTALAAIEAADAGDAVLPVPLLRKAFVAAHRALRKIPAGVRYPPASTLVGGYFYEQGAVARLANVGDSLAYLLRDGQLERLFVPQGRGNWVQYCLGDDIGGADGAAIKVLDPPLDLRPGDRFLLASDGIDPLGDETLKIALSHPTARGICERLLRELIDGSVDEQDNATMVAITVDTAEGEP